ncbi:hypothetical protein [Botrimarina sp.]|uniref:hypothetical protein n=1 Tax=Botrimarina sp. TaxID=2795802 RepID=UPI0032EEBFA4
MTKALLHALLQRPMLLLLLTSAGAAVSAAGEIGFWVGEGANRATLVIDWDEAPHAGPALAWGYRWDGAATGRQMLAAVVAADERLFAKLNGSAETARLLYGLGYDGDANGQLPIDSGQSFDPDGFALGFPNDTARPLEAADLWAEGFADEAFWHYTTRAAGEPWGTAGSGFSTRALADGDADGWVLTLLKNPEGMLRNEEELFSFFPSFPTAAPRPGPSSDFNGDGAIDAADYTLWRDALGEPAVVAGAGADADRSGLIDQEDYQLWAAAYGRGADPAHAGPAQAAPEPDAALLATLILLATSPWRRSP